MTKKKNCYYENVNSLIENCAVKLSYREGYSGLDLRTCELIAALAGGKPSHWFAYSVLIRILSSSDLWIQTESENKIRLKLLASVKNIVRKNGIQIDVGV